MFKGGGGGGAGGFGKQQSGGTPSFGGSAFGQKSTGNAFGGGGAGGFGKQQSGGTPSFGGGSKSSSSFGSSSFGGGGGGMMGALKGAMGGLGSAFGGGGKSTGNAFGGGGQTSFGGNKSSSGGFGKSSGGFGKSSGGFGKSSGGFGGGGMGGAGGLGGGGMMKGQQSSGNIASGSSFGGGGGGFGMQQSGGTPSFGGNSSGMGGFGKTSGGFGSGIDGLGGKSSFGSSSGFGNSAGGFGGGMQKGQPSSFGGRAGDNQMGGMNNGMGGMSNGMSSIPGQMGGGFGNSAGGFGGGMQKGQPSSFGGGAGGSEMGGMNNGMGNGMRTGQQSSSFGAGSSFGDMQNRQSFFGNNANSNGMMGGNRQMGGGMNGGVGGGMGNRGQQSSFGNERGRGASMQPSSFAGGGGGGNMIQQQRGMMGGDGRGGAMMDQDNNYMTSERNMDQGGRMDQRSIRQGNDYDGRGSNSDKVQAAIQQRRMRQSGGYGSSIDRRYDDDDNFDYYRDPSQPLFGQQYYQRQGNSEDFRQASSYIPPQNRLAMGIDNNSYMASYKDDSNVRERRLQGYRMSASPDNFGWDRGNSHSFRQTGRGGRAGYAYTSGGEGRGRQSSYTPRERALRQQEIDRLDYEDSVNQGRSSREILRGATSILSPVFRGGSPDRENFENFRRLGGSMRESYPRNNGMDGDYYDNDYPRYDVDVRRSSSSKGGYEGRASDYFRQMNNDDRWGYDSRDDKSMRGSSSYRDNDRRSMQGNSGYAYDRHDGYYDPEIVGRNKQSQRGNGKRSVWDNLRDAFNI